MSSSLANALGPVQHEERKSQHDSEMVDLFGGDAEPQPEE